MTLNAKVLNREKSMSNSLAFRSLMIAVIMISSLIAKAQANEEYDPSDDPIFSEPLSAPVTQAPQTQIAVPSNNLPRHLEPSGRTNAGQQPIYILNQSTPTATAQNQASQAQAQVQAQKQPTTIIEASPIGDSKAEQLRKSRQDTEVQTELKLVEKLEQDRMETEKKRADVLFGDRFQTLQNGNNSVGAAPVVVQPQPVYVQQPPVVVQQPVTPVRDEEDYKKRPSETSLIREEVRAAVAEQTMNDEKDSFEQELYFKGLFGMIDFADASNVRGNGAVGIGVGGRYNDRLLAEANFIYASFTKDYPFNSDISQYTVEGQFKYQVLPGMLRPVLGVALDYNYRTYLNDFSYSYTHSYSHYNSQPTSNSFDVGLIIGADVEVSRKFSIGGEFKYLKNVMNKTSGYYPYLYGNEVPLDQLSSYNFNLNTKFVF